MRIRLSICLALLGTLTACGAATPTAAPTSAGPLFAPFSSTPPGAVGSGLVCGAAADRLLGITDHLDLARLGSAAGAPRSSLIREGIAQYARASTPKSRDRAAGLIVGQCEAYGFYIVTYRACLRPNLVRSVTTPAAVKSCIDRRRWTVYTQQ